MFSIVKIEATAVKLDFGNSISAIGQLGGTGGDIKQEQVSQLSVPWQSLLPTQQLFPLLSWHTRISEFSGRDAEIAQLREWATKDLSKYPIWVKFVVGEGGVEADEDVLVLEVELGDGVGCDGGIEADEEAVLVEVGGDEMDLVVGEAVLQGHATI